MSSSHEHTSYSGGEYSPYSSSYYHPTQQQSPDHQSNGSSTTLRRRGGAASTSPTVPTNGYNGTSKNRSLHKSVQQLDFMFPKVDSEFTVQTDRGGVASLLALSLVVLLAMAEIITWIGQNRAMQEHIYVDTSLGKRMRVHLNITFPELACVDLHVDVMDVAGDSQLNLDQETLVKQELHTDGTSLSREEIKVEMNKHKQEQEHAEKILKQQVPENYCGPCYGAAVEDDQCCQTCDSVVDAYKKKRWRGDRLSTTAEQCIREGRHKKEPKRMTKGWGCNLSGYMTVNRVAGNFHIAMGEGVERDGRHIHLFNPDDSPNFNASHIIHELTFGPPGGEENAPLNGVTKIVGPEHGTTGLFQYFIKVVPTTYKDTLPPASEMFLPSLYEEVESHPDGVLETNRYFVTERFRPLMSEYLEDEQKEKDDPKRAAVDASHAHDKHHKVQMSVLPGVFFVYEIYPFAVEISKNKVPFTHLWIRLMATVGGVFTIARWAESATAERERRRGRSRR